LNRRTYSPNVDILETRDELTVLADMPGVGGEDIDIHFENGELSIYGRVKQRQGPNERLLLKDYEVGDFHRAFRISEEINADKINAEYKNGVLTLHLPKAESAKPRKIAVTSG
jgi:HSP20 family protein